MTRFCCKALLAFLFSSRRTTMEQQLSQLVGIGKRIADAVERAAESQILRNAAEVECLGAIASARQADEEWCKVRMARDTLDAELIRIRMDRERYEMELSKAREERLSKASNTVWGGVRKAVEECGYTEADKASP
jgi:thiazole synthase ThiGH ThiG subunit